MNVLVTAFKPFNNMINNYSTEVLKYIKNVDKLVIDVCYDNSYLEIINNYNLEKYDLIIAMGEARMRKELTLEINAKNISSCSLADNSGCIKKDEVIISDGLDVLETKVDLTGVNELVAFSLDAGKFVCNNTYYHLLYNFQEKSIFIHVPECYNSDEEYQKHANKINDIINKILENKESK